MSVKVDTDFTKQKGLTDMYTKNLMKEILSHENIELAIGQVRRNKGKPGVDGMTVDEVKAYFVRNGLEVRKQILQRQYNPQPVLRVEIPKPNGGVRLLGIPTVVDRVIQQAISQVITPIFDAEFSQYSYGFRPRKRAEMAIQQALEYMNEGYQWVVDIDLERFFDTVHHDRLMNLVARTIEDGDVISLIRKYLVSGIRTDEGDIESTMGTPQGGNLSPLLSNIMLNELDKELESRQLRFVRYADDCIILVKSEMSARRVMRNVVRFIEDKLGLIVNAEKSKIVRPNNPEFKFLGFGFFWGRKERKYLPKPHEIAINNFRKKIKYLTKRSWGVNTKYRVQKINENIRGWVNYFRVARMKMVLDKIDSNLRVHLRMCIWKLWKTPKNRRKQLRKLGMSTNEAYKNSYSSKSYARIAYSWVLTTTITNERLARFGLLSASSYYQTKHVM